MLTFTLSNGKQIDWWVGMVITIKPAEVTEVQADGDELNAIALRLKNFHILPMAIDPETSRVRRVQRFYGDAAKSIAFALTY